MNKSSAYIEIKKEHEIQIKKLTKEMKGIKNGTKKAIEIIDLGFLSKVSGIDKKEWREINRKSSINALRIKIAGLQGEIEELNKIIEEENK